MDGYKDTKLVGSSRMPPAKTKTHPTSLAAPFVAGPPDLRGLNKATNSLFSVVYFSKGTPRWLQGHWTQPPSGRTQDPPPDPPPRRSPNLRRRKRSSSSSACSRPAASAMPKAATSRASSERPAMSCVGRDPRTILETRVETIGGWDFYWGIIRNQGFLRRAGVRPSTVCSGCRLQRKTWHRRKIPTWHRTGQEK